MTPIKRLNYFKGQFLKADDFIDEQEYHVRMRRLHNSSMHTWGVVAGLEVVADATGVKVSPGSAIDKEGKEIRLLDETRVTNPGANGDHYIVVSYKDVPDTPYPAEENKYIRWLETGELSWVAATPPPANDADLVKLARVTVSGGKVTPQSGPPPNPDNSVRRTASSLRANSNGDLEIRPVNTGGCVEIKGERASVKFGGVNGDVHHLSSSRDFVFNSEPGHFLFRKTAYTDLSTYDELVTITPEGALRARKISIGKVGVGIPAPNTELVVFKSAANAVGPVLTLNNDKGGEGAGAAIDFNGYDVGTNDATARIRSLDDGKASSHLAFYTKDAEPANKPLKERLRITATGQVGIGTDTPTRALTIKGEAGTSLNVKSKEVEVLLGTDKDAGIVSTTTNHDLHLRAGKDQTRMIIKADGNVGIGLTDPRNRLDIKGQLCVRGSALVFANDNGDVYPGNWIGIAKIDGADWLHLGGVTSEKRRLTLQADLTYITGSVGIGTSPTEQNRLRISRQLGGSDPGVLQHEFQLEVRGIGDKSLAIGVLDNGKGVIQAKEVNVGYKDLLLNPVLGNVGVGTINPRARLDVGDVTPNMFKSILARLGEGNDQDGGTFLGVLAFDTQPVNSQSFAIEHRFYGVRNGFIRFNRGAGSGDGFLTLSKGWTTGGSDLAELFEAAEQIPPGHVVVFDDREGFVKSCEREADTRVIGIASSDPAGVLGTDGGNSTPIALCGRVPCNVDADIAPIRPGDLLTTSPTRGHAQKVLDAKRAAGAIIGKALGSLEKGRGAITVLVALA